MSTRSTIGMENDNGEVRAIYCHWDGYPSNNGAILLEHYNNPQKIEQLLDLGDLSSLRAEIGEKQDFNNPKNDNWCLAYGRDRGEENTSARTYKNKEALLEDESWSEYWYLFTKEGWIYWSLNNKNWKPLTFDECKE
jgi:hypothetical protein